MPLINEHFIGNLIVEELGTLWGRCNYEPENNLIVEEAETIQELVARMSEIIHSFYGISPDNIRFFITVNHPYDAKKVIRAMAEERQVFDINVALMVLRYGYDIVRADDEDCATFVRFDDGRFDEKTLLLEGASAVLYGNWQGSEEYIPLTKTDGLLINGLWSDVKFKVRYPQPKLD